MKSLKRKKILIALALIFPAIFMKGFTSVYPLIQTVRLSFRDFNLISRSDFFIGFQNYIRMFTDTNLQSTLSFTLLFTSVSMILHIILGIGLALMLNIKFKGKKFLRSILLIPWAIPAIVAGIAARWAFNDAYGFVNDLIRRIIPDFSFLWLVEANSAKIAVILVDVWKDTPFFAILILAGLQGIPDEIYEAARIDGASRFKLFTHITIPHIRSLIIILTIFFSLWRLTIFDLVYAMTQGGPGSSTSLLSYRIAMEGFRNLNYGYASSIAILLLLIVIIIASVGLFVQKKISIDV